MSVVGVRSFAAASLAGLSLMLTAAAASPYEANPECDEFAPICDTPQPVPWPHQEIWTATGNKTEGAVRV